MKYLKTLAVSIVLLGLTGAVSQNAGGQTREIQKITLDQAILLSLENNYQINRSEARLESERARVTSSYGNFLPNLNVSAGFRHSDVRGIRYIGGEPIGTATDITKTYSSGLSSSITLFDGFSNFSDLSQTRYFESSAQYVHENTKRFVITRVYSLYYEVFRRQELLRVSQENLRRSKAQLERIVESNRVGAVPIVDVYRQQVQVGNDELALIQAEQNLENAKAELTFYIGLNPIQEYEFDAAGVPTSVNKEDIEQTLAEYRNMDVLTEQTLARRADIEASQQQIYAYQSGVTGARGTFWPTVTLGANYGYTGRELSNIDDSRSFNYQLQFSIPIFQRFQRSNQVQQAKVQLKQAEIEHSELRNQAMLDIRMAVLDLEASAKRVEVSEQNIVAAREEQRLAEERYNLGAGTLLDLIIANANLAQAESNTVDAIFSYYLAIRQLDYLIGEELY
jgi:outer membrane protein